MTSIRMRLAATGLTAATLLGAVAVPTAMAQDDRPDDRELRHEARLDRLEERLDHAVDRGVISPEQAAEIGARIEEAIARFEARRAERQAELEALADVLGTTVDELRDARADGRSLAEIAEANGVDVEDVIDHLVARATERLDAAVDSSRIDADRAAELEARLRDQITARVHGEGPERPRFDHLGPRPDGPRRGGIFGPHHFGRSGFGPDGAEPDAGD